VFSNIEDLKQAAKIDLSNGLRNSDFQSVYQQLTNETCFQHPKNVHLAT